MKTRIIGTPVACEGLLTATACSGSDSGGDAGPAQESYFSAQTKAGQTTVVDTVKADLAAEKTVGVRFTTQWASQVGDLTTAYYQPILTGKKPIDELQTYVTKINELIKRSG